MRGRGFLRSDPVHAAAAAAAAAAAQVNAARPEGIRDALRSLRARLKSRSVGAQMLALTLLELLVKNCGPELHLQVATKDFMGDLTHLTHPGNADGRVSRKVLQLVHAWGESFKEVRRDIPVFYDTYQALCSQGVQFPPFDPSLAPSFVGGGHSAGGPANGVARGADSGAPQGARDRGDCPIPPAAPRCLVLQAYVAAQESKGAAIRHHPAWPYCVCVCLCLCVCVCRARSLLPSLLPSLPPSFPPPLCTYKL